MGAGQSTSQSHPPSRALHVLRVTPLSPASKTTIEPLFDFVVGFEGDSLSSRNNIDASELERIVEGHEGRTLNLLVWNSKSQETRVVPIVPSKAWSLPHSQAHDPQEPGAAQPSLLGLSMRMCEPELAMDNVWHVLDVLEGSPAESAGLVPYGDYITGWSGGVLSAENDFYDLVENHVEKPLRVYVYSYDFDALREVVLVPNRHWGGDGLLGCVFGFGLLHRIPPQPADRPTGLTTPPELLEPVDEYETQELFVPADVHQEPEYSPAQLAEWRRQEQEEWARESFAAHSTYQNSDLQHSIPTIQEEVTPTLSDDEHHQNHDHDHHGHHHGHHHEFRQQSSPLFPNTASTPLRSSLGSGSSQVFSRSTPMTPTPAAYIASRNSRLEGSEGEVSDEFEERASVTDAESISRSSLTSVD